MSFFNKWMFNPPERPVRPIPRQDERNMMMSSISGHEIHCQLTYPHNTPTTLQDYRGTESIIIFMHGNADDVQSCGSYTQWLANELSCNVVTFDYPGYGFSSGTNNTSEEGMVEAAECALELVTNRLKHDMNTVILFGKSIGSFPAVSLAAKSFCSRIQGLILVSPMASAARCVFDSNFVFSFVMKALDFLALNNLKHIGKVQSLVLIIHGLQDQIVPVENSETLKLALNYHSDYPALFVKAQHNDIESKHKALFLQTLKHFVQTCVVSSEQLTIKIPYDNELEWE